MVRRLAWTMTLLFLLPPIGRVLAGSGSACVQAEPQDVRVGIFYSGEKVRVRASAPGAGEIVMRLAGPEEPLVLKRKGKKCGLLWMNVGEVHYEAVPTLYLVRSSRELNEIAAPETLRRLKLGFDALRDHVSAQSNEEARGLFGELVKLKEKDHLFGCEADGIQRDRIETAQRRSAAKPCSATGEFVLPAKTPVGEYTVDVFSFREGEGELIGSAKIHLERSSVVSFIASLATDHGLVYGCLAVAVAVFAGLFTGFLFGRGGRRSH